MKELTHITEKVIDSKRQHLKSYSHGIHNPSHLFDDLVNITLVIIHTIQTIDTLFELNHSFIHPDYVVGLLHFPLNVLTLFSIIKTRVHVSVDAF